MHRAYRGNNLYPNRIQTRGRNVEAVQDDKSPKTNECSTGFEMFPNTYDSVADRSGEHFQELANYSAVAIRIQGKAEINSRQG
jgi:hypothetical protein